MITTSKIAIVIAAMTAIGALAGVGIAATTSETEGRDGPNEAAAIAAAKVSLKQAIAIAEQKVGGKATANGIENQDDAAIYYDITVDKAGAPQQVLVDMQTGVVVAAKAETGNEIDKKD